MITVTLHTGGGLFDDQVEVNFPEGPREGQALRIALTSVDNAHAKLVYAHGEKDRMMTFKVERTEWVVDRPGKVAQLHAHLAFVRGE